MEGAAAGYLCDYRWVPCGPDSYLGSRESNHAGRLKLCRQAGSALLYHRDNQLTAEAVAPETGNE